MKKINYTIIGIYILTSIVFLFAAGYSIYYYLNLPVEIQKQISGDSHIEILAGLPFSISIPNQYTMKKSYISPDSSITAKYDFDRENLNSYPYLSGLIVLTQNDITLEEKNCQEINKQGGMGCVFDVTNSVEEYNKVKQALADKKNYYQGDREFAYKNFNGRGFIIEPSLSGPYAGIRSYYTIIDKYLVGFSIDVRDFNNGGMLLNDKGDELFSKLIILNNTK